MPFIGNNDFSGGLNTRELGHLIASNEGTVVEGIDINVKSVKTFPGDMRELIDPETYPEVLDPIAIRIPGTAGGVPNPILGRWRYYHDDGKTNANNSWVRCHGNTIEYWNPTLQQWLQFSGTAGWQLRNNYKPWAVQYQDSMYIFHGRLGTGSYGKYIFSTGAGDFATGDIPVPGGWALGAVGFTGAGLNDMTADGAFTGNETTFYRVQIERNPIGPVIFYGIGLDDMTTGGAYGGAIVRTYLVEISNVGPPDSFIWSDDGGITWSAPVVVTGLAQALSFGVTITFGAVGGHTLGDYWGFECGPTDGCRWSDDGGGTWDASGVPIFAGTDINLTNGVTVQFVAGVGHTVGNYWDFTITVNGLPNIRPTIGVPYKNRIYYCDQFREPYRLRFTGVNRPDLLAPPEGGYVGVGEDRGDPIVSLIVHRDYLFILKRSSVWRYWRDYYDNQYIEQVHGAAGCIVPQSACAYKDAFYYMSDEGAVAIYGADSDCISHKIVRSIVADPDHLWAAQMVVSVNGAETRLWATYLREKELIQDYDECDLPVGDPYWVYNTDVWVADIRRPNIINPRWVKLPHYRITNFAMPPHSNNYGGVDWQNIHFDAQQPDMNEWNPDPAVTPDPLYIPGISGGPLHYSYRWNVGNDRDQIPAYEDPLDCLPYLGNHGVGWRITFATPRYLPAGNLRRVQWINAKLSYFVRKSGAHQGFDASWARIQIEGDWLELGSPIFPLEVTWWPIRDVSPVAVGGHSNQPYGLSSKSPSKGQSLKMEWNAVGTADRDYTSHTVEFRFFGVEYRVPEEKFNPED